MNPHPAVACRLTTPELAARLAELRSGLLAQVTSVSRLTDGIRLALSATDDLVEDSLEFIRFERQCCPFLGFAISLQPDAALFSLDITGPAEAQTFITDTFTHSPTGTTTHD